MGKNTFENVALLGLGALALFGFQKGVSGVKDFFDNLNPFSNKSKNTDQKSSNLRDSVIAESLEREENKQKMFDDRDDTIKRIFYGSELLTTPEAVEYGKKKEDERKQQKKSSNLRSSKPSAIIPYAVFSNAYYTKDASMSLTSELKKYVESITKSNTKTQTKSSNLRTTQTKSFSKRDNTASSKFHKVSDVKDWSKLPDKEKRRILNEERASRKSSLR
jgi:hypothetical protein